ncbi:MAG: VWA domain-containing protein, partial [Deltaproteobacteria bacterium]|nr:VWA domain-containing protein [Deltaproteobacteria bacterium]
MQMNPDPIDLLSANLRQERNHVPGNQDRSLLFRWGITVLFVLAASVVLLQSRIQAGNHPFSKWELNGANGQFALVISLDWTPSAAEKSLLNDSLKIFAQDIWRMTEGKHQLKTLYVYTPDPITGKAINWNKADIKLKNIKGEDEADASVSGFRHDGGRIMVELDITDLQDSEHLAEMGHALAHEMGHYAYGLYDEYEGDGKTAYKSDPWLGDTPAPSLMNDHTEYLRLSTADDYANVNKRATAQWRTYGASAWGVLVRDPKKDAKSVLLQEDYRRIGFSDLIALNKEPVLTQPTNNPAVDIIYMTNSEVCILIESSTRMGTNSKLDRAKAGAKLILDKLSDSDYVSVVEFYDIPKVVGALDKVSATVRTNYKTAIDGLDAEGGVALTDGLRQALNILKASPRADTFKYIVLLTEGQNPTGTILNDLKNQGIPVYAVGVSSSADRTALNNIADTTSGQAYFATNTAQCITAMSDILDQNGLLRLNKHSSLSLTNSQTSATIQVMISDSAKTAAFQAGFPETDSLEFTLKAPNGDIITPGKVAGFPKVTYAADNGYAIYRVTSPAIGVWQMTITKKTMAGAGSDVIIEAKSDVDYALSLEITPGSYPKPMIVMAVIQHNHNIKA